MKHPCRIFILVSLFTLMVFVGFYYIFPQKVLGQEGRLKIELPGTSWRFSLCDKIVVIDKETIKKMNKEEIQNFMTLVQFYRTTPMGLDNELGCEIAKKLLPRFFGEKK